MRSGLICFAICTIAVPVPAVAKAQVTISMGNITCGQYLALPPSQSG